MMVLCIRDPRAGHRLHSLCGQPVSSPMVTFSSIDDAFRDVTRGSGFLPCPDCVAKAFAHLSVAAIEAGEAAAGARLKPPLRIVTSHDERAALDAIKLDGKCGTCAHWSRRNGTVGLVSTAREPMYLESLCRLKPRRKYVERRTRETDSCEKYERSGGG